MATKSGMSKKAFSAGVAITAIVGAQGHNPTQWTITAVAVVALIVQGVLDYRLLQLESKEKDESIPEGS